MRQNLLNLNIKNQKIIFFTYERKIIIIVSLILGFVAGILFAGITISILSGEMMVKEYKSPYDFEKTIKTMTQRINDANGWHVTSVIDQNQEVKENNGCDIGNYKIIKYCHGGYSSQMLEADDRKKIGNMMPKSFAVYEKSDGQVFISTMNGAIMVKLFGGETEKIIEEVYPEVEDMMRFINLKYSLF